MDDVEKFQKKSEVVARDDDGDREIDNEKK
jgi:hypothetical protein